MSKFRKCCEECKYLQSTKPHTEYWKCEHSERSWNWCIIERRAGSTCGPQGKLWETEDEQVHKKYMQSLSFYKKLSFPKVKLKWR